MTFGVINPNAQENKSDKEHIHTYKKHPSRKGYSFCLGKRCYSIVETAILEGKDNRCKCGNVFTLTKEDLRRVTPRCLQCSNTKAAKAFLKGKKLVDNILAAKP